MNLRKIVLPLAVIALLLAPFTVTPARNKALDLTDPTKIKIPEPKQPATAQELTVFAIGDSGRSGCQTCHGDTNLVKLENGKRVSFYVNLSVIRGSVHKDLDCLNCHVGFGYEPEKEHPQDWKKTAGLACKNCHVAEYDPYRQSIHGRLALSGDPKGGASCADCHGGHAISSQKTQAGLLAVRGSSEQMCGKSDCHEAAFESYNDYYHGRAYKAGATDAPTCWDCHGTHKILPGNDDNSAVSMAKLTSGSKTNLAKTCEKCHPGSSNNFAEYGKLIHGSTEVRKQNIAMYYIYKIVDLVKGII
jgi:nitrate/TMAO reductase-like tetraheme cytochrome c subunit